MKYFFILIISINLYSNSIKGDIEFQKGNYKKAIKLYKQSTNKNTQEVQLSLIQCYLKLGDNFLNIGNYKVSLNLYNEAKKLNSKASVLRIAKVYEAEADQYKRIKKYTRALELYNKSFKLKNISVKSKIKEIKDYFKHQTLLKNDTRQIVNQKSPVWTKSIGRLIVPTNITFLTSRKYKLENKRCSATLVSLSKSENSNIIVTAAHCLTNFDKKVGKIKFIIKNDNKDAIHRTATIIKQSDFNIDKLNSASDWAILKLDKPILLKKTKPMIITKYSFLELQNMSNLSFGSLGGFSSDIARYGTKLTYDPKCILKKYTKMYAASTCIGFKGSSGGPIVLTTSDDNINFEYNFVGVISHFKNNKFKEIYFSPHHLFYDEIFNAIKKYN